MWGTGSWERGFYEVWDLGFGFRSGLDAVLG